MRWIKDGPVFKLQVNVAPYGAAGIKVFATHDGDLIVHAGHDERSEGDGHISRRFEGRIAMPLGLDPESIESHVTSDGMLVITALHAPTHYERIIPVFPADPVRHLSCHPHVSPGGP